MYNNNINGLHSCTKKNCKFNCSCKTEKKIYIDDSRYIATYSSGHGNPAVILVTGLGERADNWMITNNKNDTSVFEGASKYTKVLAYDRPGTLTIFDNCFCTSRSSPIKKLATIKDSAKDLNLLLINSGIKPPYILVGHSLGGPIIRLYASKHPNKVAGFIFVDALSENLQDYLTKKNLQLLFEELNDPQKQGRPEGSEKTFYTEAVVPLLVCSNSPPKVPTIILTADIPPITSEDVLSGRFPPFITQEFADDIWNAQLLAQDKFASKFSCSKHIINTNSSHYIHVYQPKLVICAIKKVLEAYLANKKCMRK